MLNLLPLLLTTQDLAVPFNVTAASTLVMDLGSLYSDAQPIAHVKFDDQIPLHAEWGQKGSKRWGVVGGYAVDFEETENP